MSMIIYALTDPRNYTVRYVGKTNNLSIRLTSHIRCLECSPVKNAWLRELQALGYIPLVDIIDKASSKKEAHEKEAFWIQHFVNTKMPLTNKVYPTSLITFGIGVIEMVGEKDKIEYVREYLNEYSIYSDITETWKSPLTSYTHIMLSVYRKEMWWFYTMRCARRFLIDRLIVAYQTKMPRYPWVVFGNETVVACH